jgi:4-amino-4-deoxy-L-arabinose transferase-like glycosyltransferase
MGIATAAPQERPLWVWWLLAVLPGLLFTPLGVLTAGFAAWRAPRHRRAFLFVTVLWLIGLVFYFPRGGSGLGAGSLAH